LRPYPPPRTSPFDARLEPRFDERMWEAVELRHLRAFLVVAEELHFGRAADRLRVSQSRVSQLIRTLETIVGESLFERNSRRVALTKAGEQLRSRVQPAYAELQRAVDEAREGSNGISGELRLGILLATSGGRHLAEIVGLFERRHPSARVVIDDLEWSDPLGPLRRGEVDLTAIRFPIRQPDLTVGPVLATDERALAVAQHHPLASRRFVTVEDLAEYTLAVIPTTPREIIDALMPQATPSGRPIAYREVHSPLHLMTLVARGEIVHATIASFPQYLSYPGVMFVPISDLPPSSSGLVWRTSAETAAIRAFAKAARDVLGDRPGSSLR
jgi:DNA-binding transcriptional LysR family regulator